jgi:hypothetical protein
MSEEKGTRNFQAQSTFNSGARLEAVRSPAVGKTRLGSTTQLTRQQRTALVEKLIDFLKSF